MKRNYDVLCRGFFYLNVNYSILVKKRNTKAFRYVKEMINMVDISYIYVVRIHKVFINHDLHHFIA